MVPAPGVQVRVDDLRGLVAHRAIDAGASHGASPIIALDLQLNAALPISVTARLDEEATAAAGADIAGVVAPLRVHLFGDRIRFELDALQPGALRLETLVGALALSGAAPSPGAAAAVILTVASLVTHLSDERGPRPHGELHQGTVLVCPGGAVAIVGTGHPVLQAFLLPPPPPSLAVPRAPEQQTGAPPTTRSDVYALAAIYAQLIAGQQTSIPSPRALPDPRPGLVALLEACLSPDPAVRPPDAVAFSQAVRQELAEAGIPLAGAAELDQLLRTYVPSTVPSGNVALISAGMTLDALEALLTTDDMPAFVPALSDSPSPAPTASDGPTTRRGAATSNPWAAVLGSDAGPSIDASAAADPLSSAPAPTARGEETPRERRGPPPTPAEVDVPRGPFQANAKVAARRRAADASSAKLPLPASAAPKPRIRLSAPPPAAPAPTADAPGLSRVLLATGGAVAVGLGLMSALMYLGPETPAVDPLPPAVGYAADAGTPPARAALEPPPTSRTLDSGVVAAAPEPREVFLSVMSKPLGAQVVLDGEPLGLTPLVKRRSLPPTDYIIRVTKPGFVPWQKVVRPSDTGGLSINAVLMPEP